MVADGRNYTFTMRIGKDGTQYFRIREAPPARIRSARQLARRLASTFGENRNSLKAGFQKARRYVNRRA